MINLQNKELIGKLLEETLTNIYSELEIEYFIKINKNKNLNKDQLMSMYDKSIDTLEVLMNKLGLKNSFEKVCSFYESWKEQSIRKTIMKILTRCRIMYFSLGKLHLIFKLIERRD